MPSFDRCSWSLEDLRSAIAGIDIEVPVLDGRRVPYVFLDNGASTPSFQHVVDVLSEFMPFYSGVHRGTGFKSLLSTGVFDEAHHIAGRFIGADLATNTVIFGKNTTEMVNKVANRCRWREGDVVITTMMEHHSNDLPWRKYARVVHIGVDDTGYLDHDALLRAFDEHDGHVRFLAVTGASNITGIVNPVHELAALAHSRGALVLVDAAQLAPHRRIDVRPDDDPGHLDFVVYSAHKMYAPFGTGVLVGPHAWFTEGDPDLVGGGVVDVVMEDSVSFSAPPAREEAGSPNVPGAVALAAAIHVLEAVGMDAIAEHEHELIRYALARMQEVPGITIYGPTDPAQLREKVGVICFSLDRHPHALVAAMLSAEYGIGVRNGCFCAQPYVKRLMHIEHDEAMAFAADILAGDRSTIPGLVRASFGCYNTSADIDRLVEALTDIAMGRTRGEYVLDPASGTWSPRQFTYDFSSYFPHFSFRKRPVLIDVGEAS